jgi:hypothetical protein
MDLISTKYIKKMLERKKKKKRKKKKNRTKQNRRIPAWRENARKINNVEMNVVMLRKEKKRF